jgi:hypothetical protein
LVSTFWSSLSGLPDIRDNYKTVRYELTPDDNGARLTITQNNNDSQEDTTTLSRIEKWYLMD